ncbi:hypothetical protein N7532_007920 [Penicillium argentinense]|uniref:NADP-dependent oxidoreductase domain-containing protein n=1 Tax=Penicillium argentinense TaxID=1131581 RepID=A0A9W9K1I4_9EURO|nr:uncharacterized protein N7532_007920 [Penicillium argentinense]KAJ5089236.1 hypothetical protein N7532_007920 [Penicillium argentinense]
MPRPNTLFGGCLIGTSFTTPAQVQELLDQVKSFGIDRIDTAARYSPTNPGFSERLLGEFGLSNFSPELVAEFIAVCQEKDYIKSSVYQDLYNLLSRESEQTPLAGGFLTGRATRGDTEGTRYAPDDQITATLSPMYDKPAMHTAMSDLLDTIGPLEISGAEAYLRWLHYHSSLGAEDCVVLGASKIIQIVQNMTDVAKGPLPEVVVQKIDSLYAKLH